MLLFLLPIAAAQQLSFPTSPEDYEFFYPTAYFDHSGADWACGNTTYSGHRGSDFGGGSWAGMEAGRDVVAAVNGTVLVTHDGEFDECTTGDCPGGGGYGNYVKLQHADGRTSYYAHLKQGSVQVEEGQWVTCGEKMGEMGSSGYSTGPHLHFELRTADGDRVDPFSGECGPSESSWNDQGVYEALPGLVCADTPPCEPVGKIACGEEIFASNGDPGATDSHAFYGCSSFSWSGPEIAWSFSTDRDEPVTIRVTGLSSDLDLFVLEDETCDGSGCIGNSENPELGDESLVFSAEANKTYVVMLDGWEDAESSFTLHADCEGEWPRDTAAGDDSGDSAEGLDTGDEDLAGSCACSSRGTGQSGSIWALFGGLVFGLRRRVSSAASKREA